MLPKWCAAMPELSLAIVHKSFYRAQSFFSPFLREKPIFRKLEKISFRNVRRSNWSQMHTKMEFANEMY